MRSTRFTSLKLATCLAMGLIVSSTGCKMPWGSSSSWSPSSLVWNPMKMWKSDAPPPASSLAATSKPSTQIPTPGPTSSVATRTPTSPAANNWATTAPPVHTSNGYGGATANATASSYPASAYPATANANGYPTQPATSYGTPNQPGQVAPAAGYGAGSYSMTASPAGGAAAAGGYQPTYTASAQPTYQANPYQSSAQPAAGGYQSPAAGGYQQPTYNTPTYTAPADNGGGYNTGAYNNPAYSAPQGGYQQPSYSPPAAQPSNGGYNTGGYIQGGYNSGASTQAPAAANSYAATNNGYDAAPAAAASSATPAAGNYATAYTQPTDANRPTTGMEVSGVTTGSPAVPASLATAGGYRPGSTGRAVDTGVQNAAYSQPSSTGYNNNGGTLYR